MTVQSKLLTIISMLLRRGYAIMNPQDLPFESNELAQLLALGVSALSAPADPHCKTGTRRRRFDRAFVVPGETEIIFFPRHADANLNSIQSYQQTASYNPHEGGKLRPFDSLTEVQRKLPALQKLILFDAEIARLISPFPDAVQEVHLHLIAYVPKSGVPAVASPPFVHCDSEPITFAHMLGRKDIAGGFNAITTTRARNLPFEEVSESELILKFTLDEALATFIVVDDVVAHYVSPMEAAGDQPYRVVLLIDFTPLPPAKKAE